jgi:hypothetical protein
MEKSKNKLKISLVDDNQKWNEGNAHIYSGNTFVNQVELNLFIVPMQCPNQQAATYSFNSNFFNILASQFHNP